MTAPPSATGPRPSGNVPESPIAPPRLPAAAAPVRRGAVADLFTLTLLSAIDGSLLALAASGQLSSLGGAVATGLTVVAGAGSWLAAREAFGAGVRSRRDWALLGLLAAATLAATVASVWVGLSLGRAVSLHILPKAAGIAIFLVAAEVAGWRLPRPARVPLPALVLAGAVVVELVSAWIP